MKPVDEYQGLYYLSAAPGEQSDASKPVELTMMGHRDVMLTVSLTGLALLIAAVIIALAFCRCRRNRGLRHKLAGMNDGAVHTSVDTEAGADRSRCGKLHNSLTVGSDPRQSPSGNAPKSNVIKNRSLLAKTTSLTSSLSQATADAAATLTAPFSPTSKVADPSQQVNGTIAVKTPLISLKSVGNQLGSGKNYSNGMTSAATHGSMTNVAKPEQHPAMAFWQAKSTSLLDMYIDTSEPTDTVGQIHFSLEYDFTTSTLILKIIQGKDLPAKDLSGTSDPYVRVTLLPDKKHRLETKIKRRTLNPKWNETFYFEGFPIQKLQNRVLHLHVFDYDRFSRDDSIGEVFMPLCQVDLSEKPVFWKGLRPLEKDKCGELLISLCYHPTQSQLTLVVLKARNLKAKDFNGKSDPYVKIWLHFGEKRVEKRKTPVFKNTLNPVFNETFAFEVPWERIREASLNVQVMDFDSVGRNELIGRLIVAGKNATGATEGKHWSDMISKPRQSVLQWHRLKPE